MAGKAVSEAFLLGQGVKILTENLLAQTDDGVGGGGRERGGREGGHLELFLEICFEGELQRSAVVGAERCLDF